MVWWWLWWWHHGGGHLVSEAENVGQFLRGTVIAGAVSLREELAMVEPGATALGVGLPDATLRISTHVVVTRRAAIYEAHSEPYTFIGVRHGMLYVHPDRAITLGLELPAIRGYPDRW